MLGTCRSGASVFLRDAAPMMREDDLLNLILNGNTRALKIHDREPLPRAIRDIPIELQCSWKRWEQVQSSLCHVSLFEPEGFV